MGNITSLENEVNKRVTDTPLIRNFRHIEKNTLKAIFDLELPSGLVVCGCMLHQSHGRYWIAWPAKPYSTPDGRQSWAKIIHFRDRNAASRLQNAVLPLALQYAQEDCA
jgi:hypothetical protein